MSDESIIASGRSSITVGENQIGHGCPIHPTKLLRQKWESNRTPVPDLILAHRCQSCNAAVICTSNGVADVLHLLLQHLILSCSCPATAANTAAVVCCWRWPTSRAYSTCNVAYWDCIPDTVIFRGEILQISYDHNSGVTQNTPIEQNTLRIATTGCQYPILPAWRSRVDSSLIS